MRDAHGYKFANGFKIRREEGKTPNGNPINGRWVLRDQKDKFIDVDQYRHDLASRHKINLEEAQ